jgi:hypothetical protein
MTAQNTPEVAPALTPHATWRDRLAAATLWLPVVAVSVTATLWYDQLPTILPRQWNGPEVTSTVGTEVFLGIVGTLALVGALGGLIVLSDAAADIRRGLLLAAGFVAGLSASVWLVIAGLVMITGSPEPDAGAWPALAVLGSGYGLIPFALSPRRPHDRQLTSSTGTTDAPLGATETGAWFTTVTVPLFLWLGGVVALAAVAVTAWGIAQDGTGISPTIAVTLALVTGACLAFARLRVSVDRRGLRVVSSLFRVPIKQLALTEVASARAEAIRPLEWGGWGYRTMPGRSAVVLTSGPGIVVQRHNGTLFAVTVPEPDLPAALLTTLAAR